MNFQIMAEHRKDPPEHLKKPCYEFFEKAARDMKMPVEQFATDRDDFNAIRSTSRKCGRAPGRCARPSLASEIVGGKEADETEV
jgi:hypothetical protein